MILENIVNIYRSIYALSVHIVGKLKYFSILFLKFLFLFCSNEIIQLGCSIMCMGVDAKLRAELQYKRLKVYKYIVCWMNITLLLHNHV